MQDLAYKRPRIAVPRTPRVNKGNRKGRAEERSRNASRAASAKHSSVAQELREVRELIQHLLGVLLADEPPRQGAQGAAERRAAPAVLPEGRRARDAGDRGATEYGPGREGAQGAGPGAYRDPGGAGTGEGGAASGAGARYGGAGVRDASTEGGDGRVG
jgi:hypothetical protein